MTILHPRSKSRADHKIAVAACEWCRTCTERYTVLEEMWDEQSRTIASLQVQLAAATNSQAVVAPRMPRHPRVAPGA